MMIYLKPISIATIDHRKLRVGFGIWDKKSLITKTAETAKGIMMDTVHPIFMISSFLSCDSFSLAKERVRRIKIPVIIVASI
jgi:hypothetical protein